MKNQTYRQNGNAQPIARRVAALALVLAAMVICSGCQTASHRARVAQSRQGVASGLDDLSPEVCRAWVTYVQSQPGKQRQEAAGQLLRALNRWGGASVDACVRARVDLISEAARAQAQFDGATNSSDRARAAEGVIRLLDGGLELTGWQPDELVQLKAKRAAVQRSRDEALFQMVLEESGECVRKRANYSMALSALGDMAGLCRRFASADYWSVTDQDAWSRAARDFDTLRARHVSEFEAALSAFEHAAGEAQKVFVNSAAVTDCRTAREIRDAQDEKRLNWAILGHFRDDPREFAKAVGLLDRALQDERVEYVVKMGAATLHTECQDRLGRQGRQICAEMGSLPGYNALASFPNASEAALRSRAEEQWRNNGHPVPLLQEPAETPLGELSLINPQTDLK
ncbi:MAG: hypothetical protein WCT12_18280 [Verrucomicrobiota bacterium]